MNMTNHTIEHITDEEEFLLELLEAGNELTEEQKARCEAHPQLADDYLLMRQATAAWQPVSVEKRLQDFKTRHSSKRRTRHVAIWAAVAAAAAVAISLVVMSPTAKVATPQHHEAYQVFAADNTANDIILSTDEDSKTLTSIIVDEHRRDTEIDIEALLADCEEEEKVTIQVPTGKSAHLTLPDGSRVWLYPGSRLRFPHRFVGDTREVMLEGQAYFSVHRDSGHPFVVSAADVTTTVLGTELVVSAYEGTSPQVALVSGSVQIARGCHKILLTPGQQATATSDKGFDICEIDTEPYVQWREGYFYFDNTSLHDILVAIGRSYNVGVVCPHPEKLNKRIRFIADRNESLLSIITRLNDMAGQKITLKGNTLEL